MSEKFAGKTFSTPEEAAVQPPNDEEIAAALHLLGEARKKRDAVRPEERVELGHKFYDDTSGTEFDPDHR
ncbi:hypothetical protein [Nocardia acidivorans]|uniref:hypothetical protein n=1 Tax=Nocardia acidivorans TaxID=404580 RepID=UPI00083648DB|nr:hypothetical protein [Nocardia acidivorans]